MSMKTRINKTTFKEFANFIDLVDFISDPQLADNEHIIKAEIGRGNKPEGGEDVYYLTLDTYIGDLAELRKQNLENLQRKLGSVMQ